MVKLELAIDMGTSFTSVFQKGAGLVLREPSVAVTGEEERLLAVGEQAKRLIGKTQPGQKVVFPVTEGMISAPATAARMLEQFLLRVVPDHLSRPRIKALLCIPCGSSAQDRASFEETACDAGIREVLLVESPVCTALGLGVPLSSDSPIMVVDIGGGKTEIAVVSKAGMLAGCTVSIGGNNADIAIVDYVEGEFGFRVGLQTAEKAKIEVASLYLNDTSATLIGGMESSTQAPRSMVLTSRMIYDILEYCYGNIVEKVSDVLATLPSEVAGDVSRRGIYLCGGASAVAGLGKIMSKVLKIPVITVEEPALCTVMGAGKLLASRELLNSLV